MSTFLYALGVWTFRHRWRTILAALLALGVLLGAAFLGQRGFDDELSVPGTESQAAIDQLARTFPQSAGQSATIVLVAPDGQRMTSAAVRKAVEKQADVIADLAAVDVVTTPYDKNVKGLISADGRAGFVRVGVEPGVEDFTELKEQLTAQAKQLRSAVPGLVAVAGGGIFDVQIPRFTVTEAIGVVVALVVLLITLGSFRAAGMPLLTALLGVAMSMALIFITTAFASVSSTTPMLAVMLGLAVGIDYALFIVSRHRQYLASGMTPEESAGRATATSGSAVVFAGLTVIIALVGLAVAQIPFLAVMGIAAAVGIAVAVAVSLTVIPALLGFAGAKLTPKVRRARKQAEGDEPAAPVDPVRGWPGVWVRAVTKVPLLTVILILLGLGALSLPATGLHLALPGSGQAAEETPQRQAFDLTEKYFGPGYNGMLIVTTPIVSSTDPLGLMDDLAAELRRVPGVAAVPVSTPNQTADTGIVQVVPTTGPQETETAQLVERIRELAPQLNDRYDVTLAVTGMTAVQIDISTRLGAALLPFGIFVVGLSLILLTIVFRSVLVPIKAALGFLLTMGTALGATNLVFNQGVGRQLIGLAEAGPVISFMPIIVMGVVFGLAMDYQVFLVSRIREDFVHAQAANPKGNANQLARQAVRTGFVGSAPVVAAAAVIMLAVFAFFIPEGSAGIKPVAFGMAVGVFVDAFIVRMALVPALLTLLGDKAWWLPQWLAKRLPQLDVEGDAIRHQAQLADWPHPGANKTIYTEALTVPAITAPVAIDLEPGEILLVDGPETKRVALLLAVSGRLPAQGIGKVCGFVIGEQNGAIRPQVGWLTAADLTDLDLAALGQWKLLIIDDADQLSSAARQGLQQLLPQLSKSDPAVIIAAERAESVRDLIPNEPAQLNLPPDQPVANAPERAVIAKEYADVVA